jgi:hypothetical protein
MHFSARFTTTIRYHSTATTYHIWLRACLAIAIFNAGFWLFAMSAEAQTSSAVASSHFRNQSHQETTAPFAFFGFGEPLPGIANSSADLANFNNGLLNFQEVETSNPAHAPVGPAGQLGPLFNNTSCAACHSNPSRGGGGLALMEQRLSIGGPPVRIFAVDHMMFGGALSQNGERIFQFGQIARRSEPRSAFLIIRPLPVNR